MTSQPPDDLSGRQQKDFRSFWDRGVFLRGMGSMALALALVYPVHFLAPVVTYPASRFAALIRDRAPGGLATALIEGSVALSNKTGLDFLEHAALAALSLAAHVTLAAAGGAAALVITAAGSPVRRARRGLLAAAVLFTAFYGLAATGAEGMQLLSAAVYAGACLAFASLATGRSVFRISEPAIRGEETPLDALRRSRRRFLRRAAAAMGGFAAGGFFVRALKGRDTAASVQIVSADERFIAPAPDPAFQDSGDLSPEITATEDFYNVDINISKPSVDHESWKLKLTGMVNRPLELNYRELQTRFPIVEMASTLSCISNEVGGDLVSTAVWRGVRLRDVLQAAGVQSGAAELIFRAADGYSDSIPLEKGLHQDTLIAFGMNGAALPRNNGFPARMVIPGIYGMKNVKWLSAIEVSERNYSGYWQKRGWSDGAVVKTQSRIDAPNSGATLAAGDTIGGVAWAGDRRISQVEVSQDGGKTWRMALLKRELAPNAWRLWQTQADKQTGKRRLLVRATDGAGKVQAARRTRTHPSGASGLHGISVRLQGGRERS